MRVTFADAYHEIAEPSIKARALLTWWRRKYASIVPAVESFVHEKLFEISSADVQATLDRGTHALGDIRKESELKVVEDLPMPPTAVQDLFHLFLETRGALPTWPEFRDFLHDPRQKKLFLDPWWQVLRPRLRGYSRERVGDAIQWRLGRMYYSNLREIDMLARMREQHDLNLKYHILADVRLRTDFWIDDANISVFLSNERYRGNRKTRKNKAEDLLADRRPPARFFEIEFPNQYDFGKLYRVSDDDLKLLALKISGRE